MKCKNCDNEAKWEDALWKTPLCDDCKKHRIDYYGDVYADCSFNAITESETHNE